MNIWHGRGGWLASAILVALMAVGGVAVLTHRPPVDAAASPSTLVTVVGSATTPVTPSTAEVNLGVTASASSAASAMSEVSRKVSAVFQGLTAAGVPASDIETGQLSLFPQYAPGSVGRIAGYQASENLRVVITQLARVGSLIDTAVAAGANQVEGVSFLPAHPHQVAEAAYQRALADAKSQAQMLAQAEQDHVLGVVSIDTTQSAVPRSPMFAQPAPRTVAVPIYPGQQREVTTVTVRFRIGP